METHVWIGPLEFSNSVPLNNSYLSRDPLMSGLSPISKTAKRAIRHKIAMQPRIDAKATLYAKPASLTREVRSRGKGCSHVARSTLKDGT